MEEMWNYSITWANFASPERAGHETGGQAVYFSWSTIFQKKGSPLENVDSKSLNVSWECFDFTGHFHLHQVALEVKCRLQGAAKSLTQQGSKICGTWV